MSSVSRAIPAFDVRTLNFPARRRMIAGDDQTQGRPVRKQILALHQPFSEAAAPDDYRAVPVLQRSAHDFTGRRRPFVDQDDEPPFGRKYRIPAGGMDYGRYAAAFGRNDPRAFGQEKAGQSDRLIQQSSAIAPKIENQLLRTVQLFVSPLHLPHGGLTETDQFDVSHRRIDAVGQLDGGERYFPSDDFVQNRLADSSSNH